MRCRLHRTDKREAHYKDGKAAVRSLLGCCPPYGSSYVHLLQCGASAIAAQCIGHRSALHCASQRSAFVPRPWCRIPGLACLRMSGSPACIHQMTDKSGLCSCSCPRAALILGTGMLRHLPESLFCPSRAALVIGAKSTSIRPGGHLDINSALLTRSRLCAWECLATCGQNAFSVNPARKYAFPVLGLADTWAKRGMLNRSVNFTSRLALTATLVTEKPSALA